MDGSSGRSPSNEAVPVPPGTPARAARIGLVIGLAVAVAFAGLLGVRVKQALGRKEAVAGEREQAQARLLKKEPTRTTRPTVTRWIPRVDVTGTLKPWRDADVGFETPGRLVRVGVAVGDTVKAGQVLAVLDTSRAAAQVGQAESQVAASQANLALAQDNLKRTEALAATRSVPEAQVEQARQQVALAKAQLDGAFASTRIAQTGAGQNSITAPFPGIVTRAPTGIGSVVMPGVPLVHLEDTARLRLSASVGEDEVPLVGVGAAVKVLYRERVVEGKVVAIVPSLDQATRRAPVEIEVPNVGAELLAWSFVRARITGRGEIDAVRVPALARRPGSQDEVVVAVGSRAKIVKVSFAVDDDGSLIVQRGLAATDEVVLSPSSDLKAGDALDVSPSPSPSPEKKAP
jgi:RND family efflux transporter MFP subunit